MILGHRIVLTGGGTGGHIYPALAVAENLKDDADVEAILYIGAKGHLEEKLSRQQGLDFQGLNVSGLPRTFSFKLIQWPAQMAGAIREAKKILQLFRPTVVLGTGGYASAPALAAARLLGVPVAVHESDAHPGMVNRLFAGGAHLVSLGMEAACRQLQPAHGKLIVNGNPVRKSFINLLGRDAACAVLGLDCSLKTVLITGGSQGAQALNDALLQTLPLLLAHEPLIQIIHQAGDKNLARFKQQIERAGLDNSRYVLRAYFDDLSIAYACSDIALCRAGAMTVAELAATGTAALFIPYPYAAADHQTHNANFIASRGAATVIKQSSLNAQALYDRLIDLLTDDKGLIAMRKAMAALGKPHAARDLANQVKEVSLAAAVRRG